VPLSSGSCWKSDEVLIERNQVFKADLLLFLLLTSGSGPYITLHLCQR
jgi:hypothetical protein